MADRILKIGRNGQLGWELERCLLPIGTVISMEYPEIDLNDLPSIRRLVQEIKPEIIINTAAYNDVDRAEVERDIVMRVNRDAPAVLAEEAKKIGAAFIHYTTDHVFNGCKGSPYIEADKPDPVNFYGHSKLEAEELVMGIAGANIIFRTAWLYSLRVGGFVNKVLHWARTQETMQVVNDQFGSPTWARMLAEATAQIIAQGRDDKTSYLRAKSGIYHLAGSGGCSKFEWAQEILALDPAKHEQCVRQLLPVSSAAFPSSVARPVNSILACQKFEASFGLSIQSWQQSLRLLFDN